MKKRKGREYRSSKIHIFWHRLMKSCGKIVFRRSIERNKDTRILVILHLFYMDSWPYIKRYLENLSPYNYDFVVTYTTDHHDPLVLDNVRRFRENVLLVEYENKGYDIGSFMDILSKSSLEDYDIVYKLQSKGVGRNFIYVYDQVFKKADWFLNLFDGILGEFSVHKAVKILMNDPHAGLVASANLIVIDPPHKRAFTCEKAASLCIPIINDYHFVAGSCFAIKASLLSDFKKAQFTIDRFEPTRRGCFSLAHALERIICASIEAKDYDLVGIPVLHPHYRLERRYRRSVSALRLLKDNRFSIDYEFFYKILEMNPVYSYEIKQMRLGDIFRYWDGKYYPLRDCSPYAYLFGDVKRYEDYTAMNSIKSPFDMSRERYDKLINSLEINGFDEKRLPIVCSLDDTVWDGQHRCCWLLSKYGEDHEIPVLYINARLWYYEPTGKSKIGLSRMEKLFRALMLKS